ENLYNFNEIGFLIGATHSGKVVVDLREFQLNDSNREMATVIEGIYADVGNLSPMMIYKVEDFQVDWFDPSLPFPKDILCGFLPNGWTDNEMRLGYLKYHFSQNSLSAQKANGRYWIIIFNGYESYVSHRFLQYCIDHCII
ncbi:hypothetical protein L873DRAFT_1562390, partial [Choiromyces venosus 120613-1]